VNPVDSLPTGSTPLQYELQNGGNYGKCEETGL